jgi:hypothetical protein
VGELVEHVEHPILASVMGAVLDEVVRPDMIALLRAQPNTRSVGQPESAALGLLRWDLQPLASPDTLATSRASTTRSVSTMNGS